MMQRVQKSFRFTNNTKELIYVQLKADKYIESYSKQESSKSNANTSSQSNFNQLSNANLCTNSSSNFTDKSWGGGAEVGAGLNAAASVAGAVGVGLSAMLGTKVEGNVSASGSASGGGHGLFDANIKRTNIKTNMKSDSTQEEDHTTNSNQQLCDKKISDYQFRESVIQTNETEVGFTKILPAPNNSTTINVELFRETQEVTMTVFVPRRKTYACKASSIPSCSNIIVEYDESLDEYYAKEHYDKAFVVLMIEWGLMDYIASMVDEGWGDPTTWIYLTKDILMNDLKFKKGHFCKFRDKLQKQFKIQIPSKDADDKGKSSSSWYNI